MKQRLHALIAGAALIGASGVEAWSPGGEAIERVRGGTTLTEFRECRPGDLAFLLDQPLAKAAAADEIIARAKQLSGAATVEILRPGDRLPFILKTDRLIIQLDSEGRVGRFWCG